MQHNYRQLTADIVRTYHAIWRGGTFVDFAQAFAAAEVALMDAYTENAAWEREEREAHERLKAQHAERHPLDANFRDGAGQPDEPSDLEPGELPGADESTTEARVTVNAAHGGPDAARCAECGRSIHVVKCEMCACGKFSNQTGEP